MSGGGVATAVAGPAAPLAAVAAGSPSRPVPHPAARLERAVALLLRRLRPTRPGDLTRSQASLLGSVRDHGPLSLAALAALEAVRAPTASRAVDLLVRRGLLRRDVDPDDHRRQLIDLEPDAAALLARRSEVAVTALAAALDALPGADRAAIDAALPALEHLVAGLDRD